MVVVKSREGKKQQSRKKKKGRRRREVHFFLLIIMIILSIVVVLVRRGLWFVEDIINGNIVALSCLQARVTVPPRATAFSKSQQG